MPQFNRKFDLGHIVTILVILVSMAMVWGEYSARFSALERAILKLEGISERQARVEALLDQHRQDDRLMRPGDCPCPPSR
jgi:hypothetical protein